MHPDIKMGLAVGLALVGLVGAMFYRHEPDNLDTVPPPLADQAAIDKEIAQSPRAPYLNPIDDLDKGEAVKPAGGTTTGPGAANARGPLADPGDDLDATDRETGLATARTGTAEPDPLRPPARREEIPAHNREWTATPSRTENPAAGGLAAGPAGSNPNPGAKPAQRRHVVQAGDTLTRIAERYLGSKAYVRDIYQANRDRMRSIDDLPEGASLVIPDPASLSRSPGGSASTGTPPAGPPREPAPARTRVEDEDAGEDPLRASSSSSKPFKLTFEPVRRRRGPSSSGLEVTPARGGSSPEGRLGSIDDGEEPLDLFESQDDSRLIDRRRQP
ncbi:MAG: LysM peptidoglycan-binding domain-containing protein [Planctomycetaceae bacterium]